MNGPTNGPPRGPRGSSGASGPASPFAQLLTAVRAVAQGGVTQGAVVQGAVVQGAVVQGAETAGSPTGDAASVLEPLPAPTDLLAVLAALAGGVTPPVEDMGDSWTGLSLLDRLAGAGEGAADDLLDGTELAEALMALLATRGVLIPATEGAHARTHIMVATPEPALGTVPTPGVPAAEPDLSPEVALSAGVAGQDTTEALDTTEARDTEAHDMEAEATQGRAQPASVLQADAGGGSAGMPAAPRPSGAGAGAPTPLTDGAGDAEATSQPLTAASAASAVSAVADVDARGDVGAKAAPPSVVHPTMASAASPAASAVSSSETVAGVTQPRYVANAALAGSLADTVQGAVLRGDSEVRLVLNPPELGHLDIRIAVHEGGLRVTLEAAQSGARELLERALPALQQGLEAREQRVDRLEVRAADTGAGADSQGMGEPSSDGRAGQDGAGPEWSAVASLGLGGASEAGDAGAVMPSRGPVAQDGRLDVMA